MFHHHAVSCLSQYLCASCIYKRNLSFFSSYNKSVGLHWKQEKHLKNVHQLSSVVFLILLCSWKSFDFEVKVYLFSASVSNFSSISEFRKRSTVFTTISTGKYVVCMQLFRYFYC